MEKVEWHDVQGLITSGYRDLPYSAYVVWRFLPGNAEAAKAWLGGLADRLMRADATGAEPDDGMSAGRPPTHFRALKAASIGNRWAIHLALTANGLRHIRLDEERMSAFSFEFLEGMAPQPKSPGQVPRRTSLLGDAGDSSPQHWQWGGWGQRDQVDGLLLLYAADEPGLDALVKAELGAMEGAADVVVTEIDGNVSPVILYGRIPPDRKEHFGFVDGISQPMIEGSPRGGGPGTAAVQPRKQPSSKDQRIAMVKSGEFILGYRNERRERIVSPSNGRAGEPDLLRNGTYLVFRQLEQDVDAFENFTAQVAERMHGEASQTSRDDVAARLIGRSRCGQPLVRPAADSVSAPFRNDFLYAYEDGSGVACPVGAHIRRANPRDSIGSDPDVALRLSKMHRIIRRGRIYGSSHDSRQQTSSGDTIRRGTAFIALNADIAGQFEMIQHSWLNNPQFGGIPGGTDPIGHVPHPEDEIVIQQRPFNLHIKRPAPFVTVRGGAYFFMPGITAVRALAKLGREGNDRPSASLGLAPDPSAQPTCAASAS